MIITDNKKARSLENKGLIDVDNYEVNQHDYCTTKPFKPKQPAFNYW